MPLEASGDIWGELNSVTKFYFILDLKRKSKKKLSGYLKKNPGTYETLPCKGEPYRLSG